MSIRDKIVEAKISKRNYSRLFKHRRWQGDSPLLIKARVAQYRRLGFVRRFIRLGPKPTVRRLKAFNHPGRMRVYYA